MHGDFVTSYALAEAQVEAEAAQAKVEIAYKAWKEGRKRQMVAEILRVTGKAPFASEETHFRVAQLVERFANGFEYANRPLVKL